MKTLCANINNDLFINDRGVIEILDGALAIRQNAITAMQTRLSEPVYAIDTGVPYFETVWNSYNPNAFEVAARATLLGVPGVVEVVSFELFRSGDQLDYRATVLTDQGLTVDVNTI